MLFDDEHISTSFTLIGVPPQTEMTQPPILEGRWLYPGEKNAVFVDADMANLIGSTHVGDDVVLRIGNDERPWHLVGIASRMFSPRASIARTDYERLMGRTRNGKT